VSEKIMLESGDISLYYEGYPESNFHFHVKHEVVGAARRGCTAV
jgi:hypothetical protein